MKLIFSEYLGSLKERGELDAIMPDLLSELGFTVFSKPAIGTKQHGVDVAAVGPGQGGQRTLFLISIKPGDLRRSGWDVGAQSLRTSLNQILDVYIANHIPKRYADLPAVIVLCLGGQLHEDVRADVEGYMAKNTKGRIAFDLWNGDSLADLLLSGVLREKALPDTWRSDFRKSVALVDEPRCQLRSLLPVCDQYRRQLQDKQTRTPYRNSTTLPWCLDPLCLGTDGKQYRSGVPVQRTRHSRILDTGQGPAYRQVQGDPPK